jgi:hypothetical protein
MAQVCLGSDHLKRWQEALGIEGMVKSIKMEMDIKGLATVEVVRFVERPGMDGLIKELARYRLEPLAPESGGMTWRRTS